DAAPDVRAAAGKNVAFVSRGGDNARRLVDLYEDDGRHPLVVSVGNPAFTLDLVKPAVQFDLGSFEATVESRYMTSSSALPAPAPVAIHRTSLRSRPVEVRLDPPPKDKTIDFE